MATKAKDRAAAKGARRAYRDLHEHLAALDEAGLLCRIDEPINKDTELHPLVRWQFRGGIPEADRKAFLFTNVTDSLGRAYDMPVAVGALSTNAQMYAIGVGVPVAEIGALWNRAIASPIDPVTVEGAARHEVVITGEDLRGEGKGRKGKEREGKGRKGKGMDALPVPISTPGYDCAPHRRRDDVPTSLG